MIRQPNVILGNDELLVTMGRKGEILGLFYPRRDHAQHVEESLACIHTGERLLWTNDNEWHSIQNYIEDTNIVSTKLYHDSGIRISILDLVHPEVPVLIRRFKVQSQQKISGKFFYYSNLNVGETSKKNSAFCDSEARLLAQYWQDYYIGIYALPEFTEWQVGKAMDTIWWTNSKYDMEDGKLQRNKEDIGNINNAAGWDLELEADGANEFVIFIGAASSRSLLYKRMRELSKLPLEHIFEKTREYWVMWLSKKHVLKMPGIEGHNNLRQELFNAYNRSLLMLYLLNDRVNGSFVAAPEFDSNLEKCGGYGFCWNRDTSELVLALKHSGYPDYCDRFFKWCIRTQLPDGSWFQRYWLNGDIAPSWGNFDYSTQIDETGATLHAMDVYYRILEGLKKVEFLEEVWVSVLRAAEYLMKRTKSGLHESCMDLWETYYGIFTYTNASIYAGLMGASHLAEENGESGMARRWKKRADFIKQATIDRFWLQEGYFAKGIIHEKLDKTLDASVLGAYIPFRMISPEDPVERDMILFLIENIQKKLSIPINNGYGIKRYENDTYIDGNPWIVTTLWLSEAMFAFALDLPEGAGDQYAEEAKKLTEEGIKCLRWALAGATSTGLLPEQVDKSTGKSAWAIPLGWSGALMLNNIILFDKICRRNAGNQE
ncbi:Glucoamylase [Methanosarcina mazei Tuc01]|uniref:Glucoamylase n=1 Tax=Methanosarcina mazei Tuc01 TaxID=1236903 RepID=M1PVM7_METMZ|nr:glycoside hydrolase family 15 protein [Methanosarcina mazei]AGF96291.1 Glucoamylase [Methanosarcina mazei Tuc01]